MTLMSNKISMDVGSAFAKKANPFLGMIDGAHSMPYGIIPKATGSLLYTSPNRGLGGAKSR
jgi:hypothetical protein